METTEIKAPKPTNTTLLKPDQIIDYEEDVRVAKAQLESPNIQDKGAVRKRLASLEKDLNTQRPEPVTDGKVRDALDRREKELRGSITHGMLSAEEMRKCGPTAVDRHMRWERGNIDRIMEWKNIRRQLSADMSNPDTWDRDVANLEQYRPEGREQGIRLDSVVQGVHAMSPVAKENWPLGEPTVDTPLKQAARREGMSVEAKATLSAKMKALWAERRRQAASPIVKE